MSVVARCRSRSGSSMLDCSASSYTSLKDVSQSSRRKDSDLSTCDSLAGTSAPLLQGWVLKRSKRLHVWRPRYASLWSGCKETFDFAAHEGPDEPTTESFTLQNIRNVRVVGDAHYGRPNCLVVEYIVSSTISDLKCRFVGMQLPSSLERDRWVSVIERATAASVAGYGLPESMLSYGQTRKVTHHPTPLFDGQSRDSSDENMEFVKHRKV